MKAIPSLFVGLAAALAGCSSWRNVQTGNPLDRAAVSQSRTGSVPVGAAIAPTPDVPGHNAPRESERDAAPAPEESGRVRESSTATVEPAAQPESTIADQAAPQPDVWRADFESQERRPIHTLRVGEGEQRVFVTGSLRGNDLESVRLLDAIATRLTTEPPWRHGSRCLLLRSPNPDGLAAAQLWNANGVDLNRNFPSLRFIPLTGAHSGTAPASETETRIMLRLLGDLQPDRVVQIRTADVPAMLVFVNRSADAALSKALDEMSIGRGRFAEVSAVGSLEEFASQRLGAETITVVVPESMADRPTTVDTLLTLCTRSMSQANPPEERPVNGSPPPVARTQAPPGPAALTGTLEPISQDGAHGYVELLPPPPDTESAPEPSGYYELPPPV